MLQPMYNLINNFLAFQINSSWKLRSWVSVFLGFQGVFTGQKVALAKKADAKI